jgi:phage terminase small subunit
MMKLTEKQKRFADYYIETGNITDAYQRAYGTSYDVSRKNGGRLMANEGVKAYIAQKMAEKDNNRIASQDEVLQLLTQFARGEIQEEQVVAYRKHYEIVTRQVAPRDRIKAAELLGKRYALFTDKLNHSGEVGIHVEVDYDEEDDDGEGTIQ